MKNKTLLPTYDFSILKEQGLKIKKKKKVNKFINHCGLTRFSAFSSILINKNERFIEQSSTVQLMKLIEFNNWLGLHLIKFFLDFEERLNITIINCVLRYYHLDDRYILDMDNPIFLKFDNDDKRINLKKGMYEHWNTCHFLDKYKSPEIIPLSALSLSWSFFTTTSFFQSLKENELQAQIIKEFGFKYAINIKDFENLCHIIRQLRNSFSHNDCFILTKFNNKLPSIRINYFLSTESKYTRIYDVCVFLKDYWENSNDLIKAISKKIKRFGFKKIIRKRLCDLLGWDISSKK